MGVELEALGVAGDVGQRVDLGALQQREDDPDVDLGGGEQLLSEGPREAEAFRDSIAILLASS